MHHDAANALNLSLDVMKTLTFYFNIVSLVITAILGVLPLQRMNYECNEAYVIVSTYILSAEPIPVALFEKVTYSTTLCCVNPLKAGTTDLLCCYYLCDCT